VLQEMIVHSDGCRHHTQMHFKCTHFFNHFQIARLWRWYRFPVYIKTMRSCFSMFDTSSQSFQRQDDQEHWRSGCNFMFLSSSKQTKCTLENDVIHQLHIVFMYTGNLYHLHDLAIWKWLKKCVHLKCICVWCLHPSLWTIISCSTRFLY
jgi:hypothetical protein